MKLAVEMFSNNRFRKRFFERFFIVFILVPYIAFLSYPVVYSIFYGTSVAFQSSDGRWAEAENSLKGPIFNKIVNDFELYKITCNAPNVTLQRLTVQPRRWSGEDLCNNYSDPKWYVPLVHNVPPPKALNYAPGCATRKIAPDEQTLAQKKAAEYISALRP